MTPRPLILILLALSTTLSSQTFEEYAKQRQESLARYQQEYAQQLSEMKKGFDSYVAIRDKEFSDYLRQRWDQYQLFTALQPEQRPKPLEMPGYQRTEAAPITMQQLPLKPISMAEPEAVPMLPVTRKTEPETFPVRAARFNFFGNPLSLSYDPNLIITTPSAHDNITISNQWSLLSNTNYNHLLQQLASHSTRMNLNSWAYYQLLRHTAENLYPGNANGSRLLTWFLMNKSGYKARIGYHNNNLLLLLPSAAEIYQKKFHVFDGLNYYIVEGDAPYIQTYDTDFPDATRIMDMHIHSPLNLGDAMAVSQFKFSHLQQEYTLELAYCKNTVNFMSAYPNCHISVYFNSAVSRLAKESLVETMLPLVQNKSETEAVGLLLSFVQNAFAYKTDQEQFGYEKFFFAEELLHYPYSDCEDRSVLFAFLVSELLNLKVIGLDYPDHIATAVKFTKQPPGEYIIFSSEAYTVCDPTYINAPIGLTMPNLSGIAANLIQINPVQYTGLMTQNIWESLQSSGAMRAGNQHDLAFDASGNAYATGIFRNSIKLGSHQLNAPEGHYAAFLAKLDPNGNIAWARQTQSVNNIFAYNLAIDRHDNIYMSGTYSDALSLSGKTLPDPANPGIFLAKFNPAGNALWLSSAALDTINPALSYTFAATFNANGLLRNTKISNEDISYSNYGINFSPEGHIILTGASYASTGLGIKLMEYAELSEFDPVISLKTENDRLIAQKTDPAIAGLLAAINLISINNVVIPGEAVQRSLDKYNPSFKRNSPSIYSSISRINFMKNDQGIITITTENGRAIQIDYMKINNNATIKITELSDGNIQLDILSGITVGKAIVWYNLNFVRLLRYTGDLLFDYARDNTQRTVNLKNDILY